MDGHPTDGNTMFCGNNKAYPKITNFNLQSYLRLAVQLLKVHAAPSDWQ